MSDPFRLPLKTLVVKNLQTENAVRAAASGDEPRLAGSRSAGALESA